MFNAPAPSADAEGMGRTPPPSAHRVAPSGSSPRRIVAVLAPPAAAAVAVLTLAPGRPAVALLLLTGLLGAGVALITLVVSPLRTAVRREQHRADHLEQELVRERASRDVMERLDRALPLTDGEADTLRVGLRGIAELLPDHTASLLLSVPGGPTVGWRADLRHGSLDEARPIPDTPSCVALATGSVAIHRRCTALDACAHLSSEEVEGSAICIPVRAGEQPVGVVSLHGPPGDEPEEATRRQLEWIAERVGSRLRQQRTAAGPAAATRPDPLTGLPVAGHLRDHLRRQVRTLAPFCVAVIEVDHHDDLPTDDAADASLRTLADVLCSTLRPDDLVCRLDGARFGVLLGACSPEQATSALERAREALALSLADAPDEVPVTFSAGVVASPQVSSLDGFLDAALLACEHAAADGGNRVALAG